MAGDVTTAKIEKVVATALALHQASCPSVRAVADALRELDLNIQRRHEESLEVYHQTEIKLLEGSHTMRAHNRRLDVLESQQASSERSIRDVADGMQKAKTSLLVATIKWLGIAVACGGGGAGLTKLLGG